MKLKKLLEGMAWERTPGKPLPTLKDVTEKHNKTMNEDASDTSWIKDPTVKNKVDVVIKTLQNLYGAGETVDGETMEFILTAIGMEEQMLNQLKNR